MVLRNGDRTLVAKATDLGGMSNCCIPEEDQGLYGA